MAEALAYGVWNCKQSCVLSTSWYLERVYDGGRAGTRDNAQPRWLLQLCALRLRAAHRRFLIMGVCRSRIMCEMFRFFMKFHMWVLICGISGLMRQVWYFLDKQKWTFYGGNFSTKLWMLIDYMTGGKRQNFMHQTQKVRRGQFWCVGCYSRPNPGEEYIELRQQSASIRG